MKVFQFLLFAVVSLCCYNITLGVTVYHIGNSHTWDLAPNIGLERIFRVAGGERLSNDWHIACGRSLDYIVQNPTVSCVPPVVYTDYVDALTDKAWDVVTLQPYPGASGQAEANALRDLINLASWRSGSGQTRYLIYCSWPIVPGNDLLTYDYATAWALPFTSAESPTLANREFFIYALQAIRSEFPDLPIEAIPVGAVLDAFHQRAADGHILGYVGAGGLYRDQFHMNDVGHFIAALTTYCVITGNSASDLGTGPIPGFAVTNADPDDEVARNLRLEIANLVDTVIAAKPFDSPVPELNLSQAAIVPMSVSFKAYTGFNYTLKYSQDLINWDDVLDGVPGDSSFMGHTSNLLDQTGFWQLLRE